MTIILRKLNNSKMKLQSMYTFSIYLGFCFSSPHFQSSIVVNWNIKKSWVYSQWCTATKKTCIGSQIGLRSRQNCSNAWSLILWKFFTLWSVNKVLLLYERNHLLRILCCLRWNCPVFHSQMQNTSEFKMEKKIILIKLSQKLDS